MKADSAGRALALRQFGLKQRTAGWMRMRGEAGAGYGGVQRRAGPLRALQQVPRDAAAAAAQGRMLAAAVETGKAAAPRTR